MQNLNILVIGNGGREHALVQKFQQSALTKQVFAAPGCNLWNKVKTVDIPPTAMDELAKWAVLNKIDLTVVGPEQYLVAGIVDVFRRHGLTIIGPDKQAAQLEGNKGFSKELMVRHDIPTALGETHDNYDSAVAYLKTHNTYPIVLKSVNLAAGKGVVVAPNFEIANKYLKAIFEEQIYGSNNQILIEEFLVGHEFSLMVLTDGNRVYSFPPIQDYKRLTTETDSPNTGGMGAINLPPNISEADATRALQTCVLPLVAGIREAGWYYRGVIFAGIMKVADGSFRVLEYNVRFGDPETELALEMLDSDLVSALWNLAKGEPLNLEWNKDYHLGIVLAAQGYPYSPIKGIDVTSLVNRLSGKIIVMGCEKKYGKITSVSGRVLMCLYRAKTRAQTRLLAEADFSKIERIKELTYRKDIGMEPSQ